MPRFEYKIVPAPAKGLKGKGVKGPEARFANALQDLMNTLAAEGWEYQRAETLPSIERSGLTGSTTEWRNVLVFRRPAEGAAEAYEPELLPPPVVAAAAVAQSAGDVPQDPPVETPQDTPTAEPEPEASAPADTPIGTAENAAAEAIEQDTPPRDTNPLTATLSAVRNASKTDA